MSVRDRIEDSKLLFAAGRLEGALISVLLGVAGTSRKRYPKSIEENDGKAFRQFLMDERQKLTAGIEYKFEIGGEMLTLEAILYRLVRNALIHEAALDDRFSFEYGDFLCSKRGTTDYFTFSSELVIRLAFIVETAPENKGIFPEGRYDRLPEPVDLQQSAIIKYQWGDQHFEIFCSACSIQREIWEETGEEIDWVHVKCCQGHDGKPNPDVWLRLLIPAMYVTSFEPGPKYQRTKKRTGADVGLFPPDKPKPDNAMRLEDIKERISKLQVPLVATTITLYRPHYELGKTPFLTLPPGSAVSYDHAKGVMKVS